MKDKHDDDDAIDENDDEDVDDDDVDDNGLDLCLGVLDVLKLFSHGRTNDCASLFKGSVFMPAYILCKYVYACL